MYGSLETVPEYNTSDVTGDGFSSNMSSTNGSLPSTPDGIHILKNHPMHNFLWRIGIIFAVSGLIILGSFVAMFGVSYSRRRGLFRRRRLRNTQNLAFENQLSTTQDEGDTDQTRTQTEEQVIPVHSSCGHGRRWSRDDNGTQVRSRSNSRSRSGSPGHQKSSRPTSPHHDVIRSPRATSPQHRPFQSINNDLEDDTLITSRLDKLNNARLAFKDDSAKYAEYDSTKDRVMVGV